LSARVVTNPGAILSFDKDDDDTLDFVLTTSNLRSAAYGIPQKTRFQVKEMAGNIIPAIATTNAIIAGFIVMSAIRLLSADEAGMRKVYLKTEPTRPIAGYPPSGPNPFCGVCRDLYIPLKADLAKMTLGQLVEDVIQGWLMQGVQGDGTGVVEWEVLEKGRMLADPDFDDLHGQTLEKLGLTRGMMITARGERIKLDGTSEALQPVQFCLCLPYVPEILPVKLSADNNSSPNSTASYELPDAVPTLATAPVKSAPLTRAPSADFEMLDSAAAVGGVEATGGKKRSAEDEPDVEIRGKKQKIEVIEDDGSDFEII
jgi:ubiquitin-like 1-activating enzyme E1 B